MVQDFVYITFRVTGAMLELHSWRLGPACIWQSQGFSFID